MRRLTLLFFVAAVACLAAADEEDESSGVTISFETTAASRYLWRGMLLNDSPSLQPSVTVGFKGLSASAWSNISKTAPYGQAWTEMDLTVEYEREVGPVSLIGTYLDYRFPDLDCDRHTEEVGIGVTYHAPLNPSLRYYRDLGLGKGDYVFAGFEREFSIPRSRRLSAAISGGVGLNCHQYITQTVISDVDLNISLGITTRTFRISPFVTVMAGHRSLFGKQIAFGVKFLRESAL